MKILQVTHRYHPNIGGVEEHVKQISERLAERHDVMVLTADRDEDLKGREKINGVRIARDKSFAPGENFYLNPRSHIPIDMDPDVVHVHNYHAFPAHVHALKSMQPVVFTPHYHGHGSSWLRHFMLKALKPVGNYNLRKAAKVIAITEWEQVQLQSDFGAINTKVIPHGRPEINPEPMDGDPFVLVVGRLESYKNVDAAIRAMLYHDYGTIIVGDGPERESLMDLRDSLGLEDRCHFFKRLSEQELHNRYAEAAVTLNLSELEAFGMSVAESLCAGTPVVANPEKGLTRWTDTEGVLFRPPRPQAIADMIEIAVDKPVDTEPLPSWEEVTERVEEVLIDAR